MQKKIYNAIKNIESCLLYSKRPVLAWSGGKDSMVLLDLIFNKVNASIPVIFFTEQWQPSKYTFQHKVIEEWGLEVYSWPPTLSNFQQTDNEFEVQNLYTFDRTHVTCPTGITPIEEGKPWVCAMDIYNRPKSNGILSGWDSMLVGHKLCDSDPIYGGDAGTRIDARINPDQCSVFFPIKDWTHDDVFQYCEDYNVPIQTNRYEKVKGKWSERADKTHNCDYVHACTACLDRRESAPKFVHCPKLDCTIENTSQRVVWADQTVPSYMKD